MNSRPNSLNDNNNDYKIKNDNQHNYEKYCARTIGDLAL